MILIIALVACTQTDLDERLTQLEANHVALEQKVEAQTEVIETLEAPRPPVAVPAPSPVPKTEGVRKVGDDKVLVERRLFDVDTNELARMGRAIPHKDVNGTTDGFRISGIRRGSLPNAMGIRNGDILHKVAGHEVNSLEGAMRAYGALGSTDTIVVELTRRSAPWTQTIEVVDALPEEAD